MYKPYEEFTLIEKIKYNLFWFWIDFKCKFHWYDRILDGCKNLIFWFPTIWKDRDFDSNFIYKILYKKLEKLENHAINCKHFYDKNEIRRITIAKNLAKRISEEDYNDVKIEDIFSDYMLKQDIELLTTYLKKYSRSWWD